VQAKAFRAQYPWCGARPDGQRPVMSQCYDLGLTTTAQQVDHVQPHRGDLALFWDEAHNWQSLCAQCGARKSKAGL
jgi:5-methylcytosine-specific restriction enzyme A